MKRKSEIAVYGLGVMGSSLMKNMVGRGFAVSGYSKSEAEREKAREWAAASGGEAVICDSVGQLLESLERPRRIFLMITAGKPVDEVLDELLPALEKGDVVLDGGNSYYRDTARRAARCAAAGVEYVGVGVSGGEKGALYGPSLMAGGSPEGWKVSRHILQAIAARVGDAPCCDYFGLGGAGHYVKMVHNGIEYAVLQLIAEARHFLKCALGLPDGEIIRCFAQWQKGKLDSYLIDISLDVLRTMDEDGTPLVDKILDVAEQKGTGKWTVLESVERGVYAPTIYEAALVRNFSGKRELRQRGSELLPSSGRTASLEDACKAVGDALLMGMILCYSQGLELIVRASDEEGWGVDLGRLTEVWRQGCIIRSALLGEIREAQVDEEHPLLLCETFSWMGNLEPSLRRVCAEAVAAGVAMPGLESALLYYDSYRMKQMPVNFIQALRDCFGAHTYRRVDREGRFHTDWQEQEQECK